MPRICDSASNPIDFCKACLPDCETAEEEFGNKGDGPDGRGNCFEYDTDHPDYDGEGYTCESCNKLLTSRDN